MGRWRTGTTGNQRIEGAGQCDYWRMSSGPIYPCRRHQDAEYTYYWYSPVNTTVDTMDRYAGSIVNAWLALEDVDVDLGPVQVLSAPPPRYRTLQTPGLTRADLRLDGDREFLRVAEIDAFLEKHHKRVLTATMRRGDILLFDQYAYHRGLPNVTPNRTRWSLDFRFQRADERTLRVEQGFLLDGSDTSLKSANDWVSAVPSLRLSEARAKSGNMLLGGHAFEPLVACWVVLAGVVALFWRRLRVF